MSKKKSAPRWWFNRCPTTRGAESFGRRRKNRRERGKERPDAVAFSKSIRAPRNPPLIPSTFALARSAGPRKYLRSAGSLTTRALSFDGDAPCKQRITYLLGPYGWSRDMTESITRIRRTPASSLSLSSTLLPARSFSSSLVPAAWRAPAKRSAFRRWVSGAQNERTRERERGLYSPPFFLLFLLRYHSHIPLFLRLYIRGLYTHNACARKKSLYACGESRR